MAEYPQFLKGLSAEQLVREVDGALEQLRLYVERYDQALEEIGDRKIDLASSAAPEWLPIEGFTQSSAPYGALIKAPSLIHLDFNPAGVSIGTRENDSETAPITGVRWNATHDVYESCTIYDATHWKPFDSARPARKVPDPNQIKSFVIITHGDGAGAQLFKGTHEALRGEVLKTIWCGEECELDEHDHEDILNLLDAASNPEDLEWTDNGTRPRRLVCSFDDGTLEVIELTDAKAPNNG